MEVTATDTEQEVTLESLADKLDTIGLQMNWLCENLQSLFAFVNQMSGQGGGIRSVLHALKQGAPEMSTQPAKEGA